MYFSIVAITSRDIRQVAENAEFYANSSPTNPNPFTGYVSASALKTNITEIENELTKLRKPPPVPRYELPAELKELQRILVGTNPTKEQRQGAMAKLDAAIARETAENAAMAPNIAKAFWHGKDSYPIASPQQWAATCASRGVGLRDRIEHLVSQLAQLKQLYAEAKAAGPSGLAYMSPEFYTLIKEQNLEPDQVADLIAADKINALFDGDGNGMPSAFERNKFVERNPSSRVGKVILDAPTSTSGVPTRPTKR